MADSVIVMAVRRSVTRVPAGLLALLLCVFATPSGANYATQCQSCHGTLAQISNTFDLQGVKARAIRAANNAAYLSALINGPTTTAMGALNVSASDISSIAAEVGASPNVRAPVITSAPPPPGTRGSSYSHTYVATGTPTPANNPGVANAFTVTAGSLPAGLSLNGTTGLISGTPTASGTFTGVVSASNLIAPASSQSFSITIAVPQAPPIITSGPPPANGTVGVPYSHTYTASGSPTPTFTVTMGALPTGLSLNATTGALSGTPTTSGVFTGAVTASNGANPAATQAFSITIAAAGGANYQGLWYRSPAESEAGWGINFAHQGEIIFATWFTYDVTGKAWWLSMTASRVSDGVFSGALYRTNGAPFSAFTPPVAATQVGTATLTFTSVNTGTFAYAVSDGANVATQSKAIVRQTFGPVPTCAWGTQTDLTRATNYQDLWWVANGAESGWGINLTHQGSIIFATWFTYDASRNPLWLSVTAPQTAPNTYSGTLDRTRGPAFSAVPFSPAAITHSAVGTATFTFANGNSGTFAYTVNLQDGNGSVSQTKAITRQVFRPPGTACQ